MTATTPAPRDVPFPSKLHGKRTLVFGGTSGIGFATASGLLASGALVHLSSSNPANISTAIARLKAIYPDANVSGTAADLSDRVELEGRLRTVLDAAVVALGGPLDHIAFTAGDPIAGRGQTATLDVTSSVEPVTVRFFAPAMIGKLLAAEPGKWVTVARGSSVVLTTGTVARRSFKGTGVMAAYTTALEGLARGLSVDLAPLRVNVVLLGGVKTELLAKFPEQLVNQLQQKTTAGELASPEDVAEAYLYLMKDHFAVGSTVITDGGALIL